MRSCFRMRKTIQGGTDLQVADAEMIRKFSFPEGEDSTLRRQRNCERGPRGSESQEALVSEEERVPPAALKCLRSCSGEAVPIFNRVPPWSQWGRSLEQRSLRDCPATSFPPSLKGGAIGIRKSLFFQPKACLKISLVQDKAHCFSKLVLNLPTTNDLIPHGFWLFSNFFIWPGALRSEVRVELDFS